MRIRLSILAMWLIVPSAVFAEESIEKLISQLGQWKKGIDEEIVRRGEAAVKPLATVLLDQKADPSARTDAAHILGKIGGKKVVEPLKSALSDKNESVRFFSVISLGRLGPVAGGALPGLAKLLLERADETNTSYWRHRLIEAISKIGGDNQDAVDALVACMKNERSDEAAVALTKFGKSGAEALINLAVKYSKDKRQENDRRYGEAYMAIAWGIYPLAEEMIPVFARHLEKGDSETRTIASYALASVGKAAIPQLDGYLKDKNPEIRVAAATSLGTMNWFVSRNKSDEKAALPVSSDVFFPKLKKLYRLPNGEIDDRIIRAMMRIDHKRFDSDPEMQSVEREQLLKVLRKATEKPK